MDARAARRAAILQSHLVRDVADENDVATLGTSTIRTLLICDGSPRLTPVLPLLMHLVRAGRYCGHRTFAELGGTSGSTWLANCRPCVGH